MSLLFYYFIFSYLFLCRHCLPCFFTLTLGHTFFIIFFYYCILGQSTARSNKSFVSNSSTAQNQLPKLNKTKLKIKVGDEIILKRSSELRIMSDFLLNDLFKDIVSGPIFNGYLANSVFSAPSGNGLVHDTSG